MKVFRAEYYRGGGYGNYEEYYALVVAECESVALGLLLEDMEYTQACNWEITEINTNEHYVCSKYTGN